MYLRGVMRISEIKESFIKYLLERNKDDKKLAEELSDADNFSLFSHAAEFKEYLKTQGKTKLNAFSINLNDINKIADEILTVISGKKEEVQGSEDESSDKELSDSGELYSEFFKDENIAAIFDTDGEEGLSKDEIAAALTNISAVDGDTDNIALEDFEGLSNYINTFKELYSCLEGDDFKDILSKTISSIDGNLDSLSADDFSLIGDVSPDKIHEEDTDDIKTDDKKTDDKKTEEEKKAEEKKKAEEEKKKAEEKKKTELPNNNHASNYVGPSGELASNEMNNTVVSKDGDIASLEKQVVEQNKIKADAEKASGEYLAQNQYSEKLGNLDNLINNISTYNSNITTLESDLHTISYDLNAAQAELNNLAEPVVFDEYKADIDKRKQELQTQITDLTTQQTTKQGELDSAKNDLTKAENDKTTLEGEIKTIEDNNPDQKSKEIINQCNQNIAQLESQIATLKSEKQTEASQLETQRKQELDDAEVFGKAQAYRQSEFCKFMMDYATDPATKAKYDGGYTGGAYCAKFTSDVSEVLYNAVMKKLQEKGLNTNFSKCGDQNDSAQGLTGDQMAMAAFSWGAKLQPALDALGLNTQATIDVTHMTEQEKKDLVRSGKVYPGMTFEYMSNGGYHTGFVESINKDLSWNTIEGNTSITYDDGTHEDHTVGAHKRDGTNPRLSYLTDSTLKALIWAYQAGLLTQEQMKARTYNSVFNA